MRRFRLIIHEYALLHFLIIAIAMTSCNSQLLIYTVLVLSKWHLYAAISVHMYNNHYFNTCMYSTQGGPWTPLNLPLTLPYTV